MNARTSPTTALVIDKLRPEQNLMISEIEHFFRYLLTNLLYFLNEHKLKILFISLMRKSVIISCNKVFQVVQRTWMEKFKFI